MKYHTYKFFIISLLLHLTVVFLLGHYKHPVLWENGMIADSIAAGNGFSAGFSLPNEPTSWQAPAYPYLLSSIWMLLGKGATAYLFISILQWCGLCLNCHGDGFRIFLFGLSRHLRFWLPFTSGMAHDFIIQRLSWLFIHGSYGGGSNM